MEWAGRTNDDHAPLLDFERLDGWSVTGSQAAAAFVPSREQQIWGGHVGKLTYRATAARGELRMLPPAPLPIAGPFDAVTIWCYGNNWGYARDASTPPVNLSVAIRDAEGREFSVPLGAVNWKEWFLLHRRLDPAQTERVRKGAQLTALVVSGIRNAEDRVLFFDNLAFFSEPIRPLRFEPRPLRGVAMFPGQSPGANTGPGKLPFPTRPETILPPNATTDFTTAIVRDGDAWKFTYTGGDGKLVYRYAPKSGRWDDLTAAWTANGARDETVFSPCAGGGIQVAATNAPVLISCDGDDGSVTARWRIGEAVVTYVFRLLGKSLVIDIHAPGGAVAEVRFGRPVGLENPRPVPVPYYRLQGGHNDVVVSGPTNRPLFLMCNADWYRSNASALRPEGTRYTPKTDGTRNECFERFFVTVAPRIEEVLPVVDNPVSPWKHVTGTHVWRAHGASNREHDAKYWTEVRRHGMTQVVVTDHETGWRDGGESFTFRTRPAPGKGGDQGQFDYARLMQDRLGFVYGPYNNFTDFAPVNEFWSADLVSRTAENQLQRAWMRCYAPKPARAVEFCARLAPEIERKFHFSTAYCDVHTAVAPWDRVDYDPRVPGAGTCAAVYYSFGEIMLLQKKAWDGPVYSEGNNHAFYCGLTDGNYGQDQEYRIADNPWFVDFDLRRLHDLCCNFGMGNPDMFYAGRRTMPGDPVERAEWLDRFLTATVAFGHPGFLVMEGGMENAMRSYFLLQQIASRYCLSSAAEILYADETGRLLDSSTAVASGAFRLSQVVTRYADGTVTAANGSKDRRMKATAFGRTLDLPPNGWCAWTADGNMQVTSADRSGARCDYAETPAYLYVDGRGHFARFAGAASAGQAVCRVLGGGQFEIIPQRNAECGFALLATNAVALDREGNEIGAAQLRASRGLTFVQPLAGAFSYRLAGKLGAPATELACDREIVLPGETVTIRGRGNHGFLVPADATPGQRIWREWEGAWIDFTVGSLADISWQLEGNRLTARLVSHLDTPCVVAASLAGTTAELKLEPGIAATATADLGEPAIESAEVIRIELASGAARASAEAAVRTLREVVPLAPLPKWSAGMRCRGQPEQAELGKSGAHVVLGEQACGGVERKGITMHPPYQGCAGYCFAKFEPLRVPDEPRAVFRSLVGKGDGSAAGDGILYRVAVVDEAGAETVAAERTVTNHAWHTIEADLSQWAGRKVRLKLIADVGVRNDSTGDWACWADSRIESARPLLRRHLEPRMETCRHEEGPYGLAGLTLAQARAARHAWLRYDGKGLAGGGAHATFALLNGYTLGAMAAAGGDESAGKFTEKVGLALTPEAIASLDRRNRFVLRNPNGDAFSIRRVWIELELADGRKASSDISTATYSQPAEWKYAEGIGVPQGQDVAVDLWFALAE